MEITSGSVARRLAIVLWLGPIGFITALGMRFVGFSESAIWLIFESSVVLIGVSLLLAILILNVSKDLTPEDKKSWRLLLFMGGPIAGCAFLTRRNRHIGEKPLNIILGDKRK